MRRERRGARGLRRRGFAGSPARCVASQGRCVAVDTTGRAGRQVEPSAPPPSGPSRCVTSWRSATRLTRRDAQASTWPMAGQRCHAVGRQVTTRSDPAKDTPLEALRRAGTPLESAPVAPADAACAMRSHVRALRMSESRDRALARDRRIARWRAGRCSRPATGALRALLCLVMTRSDSETRYRPPCLRALDVADAAGASPCPAPPVLGPAAGPRII